MTPLREQLSMLRVMPVLTVQSEQQALAVCDALASGGILAVEITLRTPAALAASEIIQGSECGHQCFKFYPAEAVGGIPLLKALAGPFAGVEFCPTGGISPHNYRDYLALANVLCVGGSWMVDPKLIEAEQWDKIESLSRACISLNEQGV